MLELEHQYGRAIKPEELAAFLAIDVPSLLCNMHQWGGLEVAPGMVRFFEKKIEAILNSQPILDEDPAPSICFYQDADFWRIGKIGKEATFKKSKGLDLIHFLLGRPQEQMTVLELEQLGKASEEYLASANGPGTFSYDDEAAAAIAKKSQAELSVLIKALKEILTEGEYESPDKHLEIKRTIKLAEETLYEKKNNYHSPESKRSRIRTGKAIWRAIGVIVKELPRLEPYLNRHTIKTGYDCRYRPLLDKKTKWILHKNEL